MVLIVFGVSGSGKTTIGSLLADTMGWKFYDADNFHPDANVEKMRQGIPLTESDRIPWLEKLRDLIKSCNAANENAVLACSALRDSYRKLLKSGGDVKFIYLKGEFTLIQERMNSRTGHFMNPALLKSQFTTLEEPQEEVLVVNIAATPVEIVQNIRNQLFIN